jgi:peptidoglycan/xylan/chitin deacetylase (PgdA/CDA1 family)
VLCAAAPGKTILLHAGVPDTVEALPDILKALRKRGLKLEKMP